MSLHSLLHVPDIRGDHEVSQSQISGTLTTSLCEDVYSIVHIQIEVVHEFLVTSNLLDTLIGSILLLESLLSVIRNLTLKQLQFRDHFLIDMESCCASANDFYRMMENAENLISSMEEKYTSLRRNWLHIDDNSRLSQLYREIDDLLHVYSNDAVYATERANLFVLSTIQQSTIPKDLFSKDWETKFTHNEIAITMVKTVEDFLCDFHVFLSNDFLYQKIVATVVQAVVCFYVRCLVQKADNLRRRKFGFARFAFAAADEPFRSATRAHCRMMYDIEIFQSYFHSLALNTPSLSKSITDELANLVIIHECIGLAIVDANTTCLDEFIIVLHTRIGGNVQVTRCLMSDLWLMVAPPGKERECNEIFNRMQVELELISSKIAKVSSLPSGKNAQFSGLGLNSMLFDFYLERVIRESNPLCGAIVLNVKETMTVGREMTQKGSAFTILQQTKLEQEEREPLIFDFAQAKNDAASPKLAAQKWILTPSLRRFFSRVFALAYRPPTL